MDGCDGSGTRRERDFLSFSIVVMYIFQPFLSFSVGLLAPPRTGQLDDLSRARTNGSALLIPLSWLPFSLKQFYYYFFASMGPPPAPLGDGIIEQAGQPDLVRPIGSQRAVFNKINETRLSQVSIFNFFFLLQTTNRAKGHSRCI